MAETESRERRSGAGGPIATSEAPAQWWKAWCWKRGQSPTVLLKNHGVFTVGKSAEVAIKAAIMIEDVAQTVWLALTMGQPDEISAEDVAKLHHRYMHLYGQYGRWRMDKISELEPMDLGSRYAAQSRR